mmetsp:Transcript_9364/g.23781  ORF Transcript_9364/g.23781 Transcript_9364/m.23781 type:complete len:88 (-) Transcript_9364:5612-5875(-)
MGSPSGIHDMLAPHTHCVQAWSDRHRFHKLLAGCAHASFTKDEAAAFHEPAPLRNRFLFLHSSHSYTPHATCPLLLLPTDFLKDCGF